VHTYTVYVSTNITLSVDEDAVERAREVARQQGTSLNALIREYIAQLAGKRTGEEIWREMEQQFAEAPGNSGGWKWNREEIYEERLGRYGRKRGG
jgi:hypothetical protein